MEIDEETQEAPPKEEVALKAVDIINKMNEATDRAEAANKKTAELMEEQATLKLATTLDGKADAGAGQEEEESPEKYAERVMKNDI